MHAMVNELDKITNLVEKHHAQLVAVSKTYPPEKILEVYQKGIRLFGENKVQEILEKKDVLPQDIQWHMIGHLQTNKVKLIVPFISLIHSVDSLKLLKEINKQAAKIDRNINILLQVHIASESSKFGLDELELSEIVSQLKLKKFPNIRCRGLMGMATFTEDEGVVRQEFRTLKSLFDKVHDELKDPDFNILSMGMSGDYAIALEEGSTMLRIGSLIFGRRNYL